MTDKFLSQSWEILQEEMAKHPQYISGDYKMSSASGILRTAAVMLSRMQDDLDGVRDQINIPKIDADRVRAITDLVHAGAVRLMQADMGLNPDEAAKMSHEAFEQVNTLVATKTYERSKR